MLKQQKGLTSGKDIRAMVRTHDAGLPYISNWEGIDRSNTRYLLDKSIINPWKYNYYVENWENYQHKMIYMIRNIRKVLKSQFLVVLAGEESYQYGIPKNEKVWDAENLTEETVKEIMDFNEQKWTHWENLQALPKDVFYKDKNMHFCTFEDFIEDLDTAIGRVEDFLGMEINAEEYPRMNGTLFEWYANQTEDYEANVKRFHEWEDFIYSYCIDLDNWESLCEYTGIDLISKYDLDSSIK